MNGSASHNRTSYYCVIGDYYSTPGYTFQSKANTRLYRDELHALVAPGMALADVTAIWERLLQHKDDLDLTGNGLNHPDG
ncbi:MAG: hypothetical protein Q8M16_06400 [Pirellulaceae bacterium]|nr:hypothetical protein [Pirellulaceae bacterium]